MTHDQRVGPTFGLGYGLELEHPTPGVQVSVASSQQVPTASAPSPTRQHV
jgi:hypothetical protein